MRRSPMLLVGVVAALAVVPAAQAGTYTVYACKKPDGTSAIADGWTASDHASGNVTLSAAACATRGPMKAELAANVAHAKGAYGDWLFTAPAGLPVVGYVYYRTAYTLADSGTSPPQRYNYDVLEYPADGSALVLPERCEGGPCNKPASPAPNELSEGNAFVRTNVRLSSLGVRVSCFPDASPDYPACHSTATPPSSASIHRAEIVLEDTTIPGFSSPPAGTLFDTSRELSGVVSASFAATDQGSGVFQAVIEVDGRPVVAAPIDDNGGRCRKPFVHRVPCKGSAAATVSLDTSVLPDGVHNVRLLVQDATATNTIPYGPVSITTRNSVPGRGTPNGTNAADGALLQAAWKGHKARELRAPFGRTVVIAGKLRNPAGQPIVGAALVITKTDLRLGASEQQLALVTTGPDGAFGHRFHAGPGMSIAVRYRAFAGDRGFSATQALTLRVRASATLTVPRQVKRGRRLRFRGRLRGGPVPRTGKLAVLQVRSGRRWNDFKTVRSDRAGRFAASVPTRRGGGRQVVRLRVLVRREAAYPYSSGASPERRVALVP